jgi:hypothetical protein
VRGSLKGFTLSDCGSDSDHLHDSFASGRELFSDDVLEVGSAEVAFHFADRADLGVVRVLPGSRPGSTLPQ